MRVMPFSSSFGEESGVGGGGAVHWIHFFKAQVSMCTYEFVWGDMPKFLEFLSYPSIEMSTVWLMY